jgi:phosphomannomutase
LWILDRASREAFTFAPVDKLGTYTVDNSYPYKHIQAVLDYPLIDLPAIRGKHFKVVVDTINSTGSLFIPPLLRALGIEHIRVLNEEVNGRFAHTPEPLPENLAALSEEVTNSGADLGSFPKARQYSEQYEQHQSAQRNYD